MNQSKWEGSWGLREVSRVGQWGQEVGVGADMLRRLKTTVKERRKGDIQNEAHGSGLMTREWWGSLGPPRRKCTGHRG